MAELRVALAQAGLVDVRTYIQSGNVIARSPMECSRVGQLVHDVIQQSLGADITVITRTPSQIQRTLQRSPFPQTDSARLYFSMLASQPAPDLLEALQAINFAPDEVKVLDDAIYTRYATQLSDSRFTNNFFERKLKVAATTRNFNTMTRLAELSAQGVN